METTEEDRVAPHVADFVLGVSHTRYYPPTVASADSLEIADDDHCHVLLARAHDQDQDRSPGP